MKYLINRFASHDTPENELSVKMLNPLTDMLGEYRIYRTPPLVPLESGCCDDC